MEPKTKLLLGLSSVGATAGMGSVFAFPHRSKEEERDSVLSVITSQGHRFILSTSESTHDSQWNEIANNLKNDPSAQNDIGTPIDTKRLKEWCEKVSKRKYYPDDLLIKYDTRCTKNTILTEFYTKSSSGKSIIEMDDSSTWSTQHSSYQSDDKQLQITIGGVKVTKEEMKSKNANDIRDWCQSIHNALFEGEESDTYKAFEQWCTKATSTPASEA